jgi:hypothetical protein
LPALSWLYARTAGAVVTHMVVYRKARVAEDLFRQLSRLSDAELAARGLRREHLAHFIGRRLG